MRDAPRELARAVRTWLETAPLAEVSLGLFAENVIVFTSALVAGSWVARRFAHRRVCPPPPPVTAREIVVAASAVVLNTVVTFVGLMLFRRGIVRFRDDVGLRAWADVFVLGMVMDLAMYALHRLAHHPWLFAVLHRLHHRYEHPRPLTLFALNPAETVSFGALWLVVISTYEASWLGMSVYLVLNVAFGTLGHVGVEPFPGRWASSRLLGNIGTSTFHAQHHLEPAGNFGFYTLVWDRLFGTLHPNYEERFRQAGAHEASRVSRT